MDSKRRGDQIETESGRSRRSLLKTGAVVIPTIVTLHASPAWATTDYTLVAYQYGANQGLCRNPNFKPGSDAEWKRDEFMPCEQIRRQSIVEDEPAQSDRGTPGSTSDVIQF